MRGVRFDPQQTEVRTLARYAPIGGADVLEVGCGDGRLTRRIARVAGRIVAIDADDAQVARARQLTPKALRRHVQFRTGAAERLPFRASRFDLVLFSWSL